MKFLNFDNFVTIFAPEQHVEHSANSLVAVLTEMDPKNMELGFNLKHKIRFLLIHVIFPDV